MAKRKWVVIKVACPAETCTVTARGTVSVPRTARVYRLKAATKQIAAGRRASLKLRIPRRARRAILRALRSKKRSRQLKAKVTVTAKDAAGNETAKKRTIRLKR